MKGRYINLQGEEVNVLEHDVQNKILYIRTSEGEQKWVSDADGQWWRSLEAPKEEVVVAAPEPEPIIIKEPEPVVEEVKFATLNEVIEDYLKEVGPTISLNVEPAVAKPKPKATKKGKK